MSRKIVKKWSRKRDSISRFDGNGGLGNGNDNRNNNRGGNNGGNGPGQNNNAPKRQGIFVMLIAALVVMLLMSYMMKVLNAATNQEITYDAFINMVNDGEVEEIQIESDCIRIIPKNRSEFGVTSYLTGKSEADTYLTERIIAYNSNKPEEDQIKISTEIPDGSSAVINILLYYALPILLIWILLSFAMRKMSKGAGGAFGVGKSNAKLYGEKSTGVTFKDVAGEDEAKESLVEVVDFLHNPQKYAKIGAKLPKGALLVGPPGTGKTLLAKAVAGEAGVPFFSLAGSDFIELYVGVGASRVRDLFKEAEKNAPCIIFIDEIDAIGRSRDSKYGGGNEEREQTLNQLLSEMDGFDGKKGIIILAATNRPEILDKALLRPGRFDRRIIVDKPDLKGREEILKVHAKDVLMDDTVDLHEIALATSGVVGADLSNMINEAAINAVKERREAVSQKDLFHAIELVLVGKEKKDRVMSQEERKIVSYHEVGHALVSALQKNSEPVQKITIVPRTMGALGYVMHVPEDEKYLENEAQLHDELVGLLAGRAAEEIVFNTVTTGASNDIEKATNIARQMITRFGMSKRFGLIALETVESQYLDGRSSLTCASKTAAEIDEEVMKMLKGAYEEALALLRDNRELMDKLAAHLIEKETITGKEFMKIYRKEKGIPEPVEEEKEEEPKKGGDAPQASFQQTLEQNMTEQPALQQPDSIRPMPPYDRSNTVTPQTPYGQQQQQGQWMNPQAPNGQSGQQGQWTNPQVPNGQPQQQGQWMNPQAPNGQSGQQGQWTNPQAPNGQPQQNQWTNPQAPNGQPQQGQWTNPQAPNDQQPGSQPGSSMWQDLQNRSYSDYDEQE